jgi:hypothetical protein
MPSDFEAAISDPLGRIARGDVELGSLFVQMHAARIIWAVQEGWMAVQKRGERAFVVLTNTGRRKWADQLQNSRQPSLP